jgi:polysaccharide pyruvyl transferase WcaK-like protein
MTILDFLKTTNLERSLLIGYYGGGNYGDELLLEVLQNLLKQKGVKRITITYQNPKNFTQLHHDFGYPRISILSKLTLIGAIFKHRNIIVGGGGLWGLDMNVNTFLMSAYLFFCRYIFRKRVFLIGVGYYNSTTKLGHFGAWLAGKAANTIIVRDKESAINFRKINKRTVKDTDLAFYAKSINMELYEGEIRKLEKLLPVPSETLFIAIRRFKHANNFDSVVEQYLEGNQNKPIILALLELETADPKSYALIHRWQNAFPNILVLDKPCNPVALFGYFAKHQKKLAVVAPQFHLILTAHLNNVPFLPLVYDNKVNALFDILKIKQANRIPIESVTEKDVVLFAKNITA